MKISWFMSLQNMEALTELSWVQRLKISLGAARALNYLHNGVGPQHRVLHRNIKSSNILLNENWEAKVSDFGLSKIGPSNVEFTFLVTNACGTDGYIDPEYRKTGILTKESDVYSFGVVLFEILCGRLANVNTFQDERRFLDSLAKQSYEQKTLHEIIHPSIKSEIDEDSLDVFSLFAYKCLKEKRTERPTMAWIVKKLEKALEHQSMVDGDIANEEEVDALIECVMEDVGFNRGKPVAAVTIYKCLNHWNTFEVERTTVFVRLIQMIGKAIKDQDNNGNIAYWLSNTSTLLFLLQTSIEPPTSGSARKTRQDRSSQPEIPLLFMQQLTAYMYEMYGIIRNNLRKELDPFLNLCIQEPRASKEVQGSNHWLGIIDCLNTLLNTMKEKFVPSIIVQKMFTRLLSYINARLFNSLLLHSECCTLSNGEYLKFGLAELELWCCQPKDEYARAAWDARSAWDELKHIRQAARFLILTIQQLHRICTRYSDDKFNTDSVSPDVISSMRLDLADGFNSAASESILPDGIDSIPLSVDDLSKSMKIREFIYVMPATELAENPAFQFLMRKLR